MERFKRDLLILVGLTGILSTAFSSIYFRDYEPGIIRRLFDREEIRKEYKQLEFYTPEPTIKRV